MAQIDTADSGDGKKVRSKKQSTKVDMAPLVDLGFLLITFFMFAATQIKPNVMNLNMPPKLDKQIEQSVKPEIDLRNSLSILIGKEGKIFWHQKDQSLTAADLNETDYSAEGIRKAITDAHARAPQKDLFTVIIKPTDGAINNTFKWEQDDHAIASVRYALEEVWRKAGN